MGFINDVFSGGSDAAEAAMKASGVSAGAQESALKYLQQIDQIPQQFRGEAIKRLGGLYGLEGGIGSQEELIQRATESPLYQEIMGGLDAGEEAILRNAAATGGLRSGNTQYNLADYSTQLQNKALLQSYNEQLMGLKGLAGLSTGEGGIADLMSQIGTTEAQGITAAEQAGQAGSQNLWNNLLGLGSLGLKAYSTFGGESVGAGLTGASMISGAEAGIGAMGNLAPGFTSSAINTGGVSTGAGLTGIGSETVATPSLSGALMGEEAAAEIGTGSGLSGAGSATGLGMAGTVAGIAGVAAFPFIMKSIFGKDSSASKAAYMEAVNAMTPEQLEEFNDYLAGREAVTALRTGPSGVASYTHPMGAGGEEYGTFGATPVDKAKYANVMVTDRRTGQQYPISSNMGQQIVSQNWDRPSWLPNNL